MNRLSRSRAYANYVAGGLACGLGGALLLGLPAIALSVLAYSSKHWLKQHGLGEPTLAAWIWNHTVGPVGQLPDFVMFVALVIAPAGLGFAYGWWAGMHRGRPREVLRNASNPALHRGVARRVPASQRPGGGRHR